MLKCSYGFETNDDEEEQYLFLFLFTFVQCDDLLRRDDHYLFNTEP